MVLLVFSLISFLSGTSTPSSLISLEVDPWGPSMSPLCGKEYPFLDLKRIILLIGLRLDLLRRLGQVFRHLFGKTSF